MRPGGVLKTFADPPKEFSLFPFWFWNDTLTREEILRQMEDFAVHGVYGFVIHPRMGLPKTISWMSDTMLAFIRFAVEEAAKRDMRVILYDEGMYPSGSSAGQVVAANPDHAARCLDKVLLKKNEAPDFPKTWNHLATYEGPEGPFAVVDRPSGGVIRGLHFIDEGPEEELPPAADILNPEATASFIQHVHEKLAATVGSHFGKTIIGIFTDEPNPVGRDVPGLPGTKEILTQVQRILGYDFRPYLPDLWYERSADSLKHREAYHRAVAARLEETFYRPLQEWCEAQGLALMGHPGESMDIGMEKYFHIPGQDVVWRWVLPGKTALEGRDSTAAKCASSAMVHLGRRRNSNEIYGAYGHELTKKEMYWLAFWCLVRGQNLLIPHAFYYSIRGHRRDERPPDVGPNAIWWPDYKSFADACRRLSWVNTDSQHVAEVAILASPTRLPERAAKICFENQWDFNYLESRQLVNEVRLDGEGLHLAGMCYRALVVDSEVSFDEETEGVLKKIEGMGKLIRLGKLDGGKALLDFLEQNVDKDVRVSPPSIDLRYRHMRKANADFYLFFNEGEKELKIGITLSDASVKTTGQWLWLDPLSGQPSTETGGQVVFRPHEIKVLMVDGRVRGFAPG